jgi:nucleotide-binding universal stress UspA family protein
MWDLVPPKILVAVELVGGGAALEYAARDAIRRGCGVHLVHVAGPAVRAACVYDDMVLVEDELRASGQAILAAAAGRTEHLIDVLAPNDERLSVSTELAHGSVVTTLDALSPHACLAVLEHRGMGPTGETETSTLSVTAGVAARSECPVVAVPSDWRPSATPFGIVAVGVDTDRPSRLVVEAALHEAARRGARLRVVHAWRPDRRSAPDRTVSAALEDRLDELVAEAGSTADSVPVDVVVESGPAGKVLLDQSATCDLVVLGRHHRRHIVGAPLGSTSRDMLRWSAVPVLVVDPLRGDEQGVVRSTSAPAGLP